MPEPKLPGALPPWDGSRGVSACGSRRGTARIISTRATAWTGPRPPGPLSGIPAGRAVCGRVSRYRPRGGHSGVSGRKPCTSRAGRGSRFRIQPAGRAFRTSGASTQRQPPRGDPGARPCVHQLRRGATANAPTDRDAGLSTTSQSRSAGQPRRERSDRPTKPRRPLPTAGTRTWPDHVADFADIAKVGLGSIAAVLGASTAAEGVCAVVRRVRRYPRAIRQPDGGTTILEVTQVSLGTFASRRPTPTPSNREICRECAASLAT